MPKRPKGLHVVLLGAVLLAGCTASPDALPPCDPASAERSICGFTNPEDIGFLPDGSWLVVSEMAPNAGSEEAEAQAGRLTALRLVDLESRTLYPAPHGAVGGAGPQPGWGDPACPGPPDPELFEPHGLDVGRRPDGLSALAVVNHGGREAVELFEILPGSSPALSWRGCVPMLEGKVANDVAFLPQGGFVVTNFMAAFDGLGPRAIWTLVKIGTGARTGSVLRWEPGGELLEIENSAGSAPNGIEVSADGTEIFVAEWGGERLYRLRLDEEGAPRRDEVALDHSPDNLTWTRDGRLLVAGQRGGILAALGCGSIHDAGCDIGYSVYAVGPVGLDATKILEGRGAASVALEVGDEIFVGAFVGDQLLRFPRPD